MLLVSLLLACNGGATKDTGSGIVGDPANGETVYASNCAGCHGSDGAGGTGPAMADVVSLGEDGLTTAITDGAGGGSMPAFGETLTEQEIADVVAYILETF